MLEPRVVPKGEQLIDLEAIPDRLFEGERFKQAADLRAGAAATLHVRITDVSPAFLPFDLESIPELARFIQVPDPQRHVVLVANVEVRATTELSLAHELSRVRMHCRLTASNGVEADVGMRQVFSTRPGSTHRSTWVGLAPLDLGAESYAHEMVLEIVSRSNGHLLRRAWTSPRQTSVVIEALHGFTRDPSGRWRPPGAAELHARCHEAQVLDGSERLEYLNCLDLPVSIAHYHPIIATGSGLVWHQAQIAVAPSPALPQGILPPHRALRVAFSCASTEHRVPRGIVLMERIIQDGNLRASPWLVPLVDESWPLDGSDLQLSRVREDGTEQWLGSTTRPIAQAVVTDAVNARTVLRLRNNTDHDVRLISVEKATLQPIAIPQATLDGLHQDAGCIELDEYPMDHAPTLPSGGTLDLELRRQRSGLVFLLVSAKQEDVPGACGILLPLRHFDPAP